jgi:predicted DNA-binding transcriptional regulator AlpA
MSHQSKTWQSTPPLAVSLLKGHGMKAQSTRRKAHPPNAIDALPAPAAASIPAAFANFDHAPDSAFVRLAVVAALFACSPATIWRRVKKGTLPVGRKLSEGVTAWNVGELRKALRGEGWQ